MEGLLSPRVGFRGRIAFFTVARQSSEAVRSNDMMLTSLALGHQAQYLTDSIRRKHSPGDFLKARFAAQRVETRIDPDPHQPM